MKVSKKHEILKGSMLLSINCVKELWYPCVFSCLIVVHCHEFKIPSRDDEFVTMLSERKCVEIKAHSKCH